MMMRSFALFVILVFLSLAPSASGLAQERLCLLVINEDGERVADADVKLGYGTSSTDAQGLVCFDYIPGGKYTVTIMTDEGDFFCEVSTYGHPEFEENICEVTHR